MPIIVKRSDDKIIESSSSLPYDMKGKYEISYPSTFDPLDEMGSSYVYPRDANNVLKKVIEPKFLEKYPSYEGVIYNPFLDSNDINVDNNATFPDNNQPLNLRYKTGNSPNLLSLIGKNDSLGFDMGGLFITDNIDIGALTNNLGSQTFMIFWRGVKKTYTQDITPTPNIHTDNEASKLFYADADNSLLKVYISSDNGITFQELSNLNPFSFNQRESLIRLAFLNLSVDDVFLLSYAIMY